MCESTGSTDGGGAPASREEAARIIAANDEASFWRLRGVPGYQLDPVPWARVVRLVAEGTEAAFGQLGRSPAAVVRYHRFKLSVRPHAARPAGPTLGVRTCPTCTAGGWARCSPPAGAGPARAGGPQRGGARCAGADGVREPRRLCAVQGLWLRHQSYCRCVSARAACGGPALGTSAGAPRGDRPGGRAGARNRPCCVRDADGHKQVMLPADLDRQEAMVMWRPNVRPQLCMPARASQHVWLARRLCTPCLTRVAARCRPWR